MIPDGDRRDLAQSARPIDEDQPVSPRNDYVVRKFVLHDDFGYDPGGNLARRLGRSPSNDIG